SLAYAMLVGHLSSVAAAQRTRPAHAPQSVTVTDLDRIVADITGAVDVATLEEAIRAGVCDPADYLHRSDLSYEQFLAGVDVAPAHIDAGLDITRTDELEAVLSGLSERHHVLLAGPSGSGKSALLWKAGE